MDQALPVYILSGFLGSGKTTLLQRLLAYFKEQGKRPAVVMNELGEVNLDGLLVEQTVPMAEMLGGCICCTIRGDLSTELATLVKTETPDVVIIEATGAANPLEIMDAVTETSLYMKLELKGLITVVDAAHLLELHRAQKGATFRLMQEQARCASVLVLNKTDRVSGKEAEETAAVLRKWNAYADIMPAIRCGLDPEEVLAKAEGAALSMDEARSLPAEEEVHDGLEPGPGAGGDAAKGRAHHSHEHVMVYTHYFSTAVDSVRFEKLIRELPREVYRAKGIVSFSDTSGRFMFQYAYREADFLRITPQGSVEDVAVFIGEHFSSRELRNALLRLEGKGYERPIAIRRSF